MDRLRLSFDGGPQLSKRLRCQNEAMLGACIGVGPQMSLRSKNSMTPGSEIKSSPLHKPVSQSERFISSAQEMGLDEREEVFDAALTKVARHKLTADATPGPAPPQKPV